MNFCFCCSRKIESLNFFFFCGMIKIASLLLFDDKCRFICRHACSYFPVTLHVEDINALHPDRAYGISFICRIFSHQCLFAEHENYGLRLTFGLLFLI